MGLKLRVMWSNSQIFSKKEMPSPCSLIIRSGVRIPSSTLGESKKDDFALFLQCRDDGVLSITFSIKWCFENKRVLSIHQGVAPDRQGKLHRGVTSLVTNSYKLTQAVKWHWLEKWWRGQLARQSYQTSFHTMLSSSKQSKCPRSIPTPLDKRNFLHPWFKKFMESLFARWGKSWK